MRLLYDEHAAALSRYARRLTGDQARAGAFVVIHPVGRERRDFEQRATRVKQSVDAIPGQQLASVDMAGPGAFRTTQGGRGQLVAQLCDERGVRFAVFRRRGHRLQAKFRLMVTNSCYVSGD